MRRLARGTAAGLRAAARYSTWANVVYALAAGAIRADATRVDLVVLLDAWTVVCKDNGRGADVLRTACDSDWAYVGLLDVDVALRAGHYTRLQRDDHVLYAGPAPAQRAHRRGNVVTLHDLFRALPVRRRILHAARRAELRHAQECIRALALTFPHIHIALSTRTARLVRAPSAASLLARTRRVWGAAAVKDARTIHTTESFGAWRVELDGVVGALGATTAHQHVSLNGVPVPRTPGLASVYALREARHTDIVPWQSSAAYDRFGAGDRSLHAHIAGLLDMRQVGQHRAFVLNVTTMPGPDRQTGHMPRDWYALFTALLTPCAARAPSATAARAQTSRFFAPSARAPRPTSMHRTPAEAQTMAPVPPAALAHARFIAQVDAKYLVCVCAPHGLLLIDQHAADERVRLEAQVTLHVTACLEARARGTTAHLHACRPVRIARDALRLSDAHLRLLRFWGFRVHKAHEWTVDAVPTLLDRLARDAELLRRVLAAFAEQAVEPVEAWLATLAPASRTGSVAALRHWPHLMTHLVVTQACHQAIRTWPTYAGFQQRLSNEQGARLVAQLAETAFPLQCAHGRPSVVAVHTSLGHAAHPVDWARLASGATPHPEAAWAPPHGHVP